MNSKAKGGEYERKTARLLSKWISAGLREDILWRSSASGAQYTANKRTTKYKSQAGDLAAITPEGIWFTNNFVIELKHYQDLQLSQLICGRNSFIESFWLEHLVLAEKCHKVPMLIAKQNRLPEILLLPRSFSEANREVLNRFEAPWLNLSIFPLLQFIDTVPFNKFELRCLDNGLLLT